MIYYANSIKDAALKDSDTSVLRASILYGILPMSAAFFMVSYVVPVLGINMAEYPVVRIEAEYGALPLGLDDMKEV